MRYSKTQWIKENLKAGEIYAGILLGKDGAKDRHVILLPGQKENINFKDATDWAKSIGGELPTRREQSLLFANCKEHFDERYYWSGERHASASDCAWVQHFSNGNQTYSNVSNHYRARAVRRLVID